MTEKRKPSSFILNKMAQQTRYNLRPRREVIDLTDGDDVIDLTQDDPMPPPRPKGKPKAKPLVSPAAFPKPNVKRRTVPPARQINTIDMAEQAFQRPERVKDFKLKPLQQLQRPYFSPVFDSYEMDYVNTGTFFDEENQSKMQNYLFVININTKFLISVPLPMGASPSVELTIQALQVAFNKLAPSRIENVRGDADTAFGRTDFNKDLTQLEIDNRKRALQLLLNFLKTKGVRHAYFSSSKFINKNRCVDRAIRTIRDLIGLKTIRLLNPAIVGHLVDLYNETPHSAYFGKFSPAEVQNNPEIEGAYIRYQNENLQLIKQKEKEAGLTTFKPGNILLVYIPKEKTPQQFDKRRRNFSDLAVFIEYLNGNVRCELLDKYLFKNPIIQLPVYFTKFVCEDIYQLPPKYKDTFLIRG
jgi:hypothetical protein